MDIILSFKLLQIVIIYTVKSSALAQEEDYCNGEIFEPHCNDGEIIIMETALYGQMDIGRCLPTDMGYLGCKSDVLDILDQQCSGKKTCSVIVGDATINTSGGCMKGLMRYLKANYSCKHEQILPNNCKQSHNERTIELDATDVYISSNRLLDSCTSKYGSFKISALEGQVLNISVDTFVDREDKSSIIGYIEDPNSEVRVPFDGAVRKKNLLLSSTHEVDISIQKPDAKFVLHFKVLGCQNMPPPQGAWMTRNGDNMEIGCHSGSKTWTLQCQNSQWIGAVGQCGGFEVKEKDKAVITDKVSNNEITLDAMAFGISSVIILLSAVIFLIGVCVLKRKIRKQYGAKQNPSTIPHTLHMPDRILSPGQPQHTYDMYMNTGKSLTRDSVQYFVLENSNKSSIKDNDVLTIVTSK